MTKVITDQILDLQLKSEVKKIVTQAKTVNDAARKLTRPIDGTCTEYKEYSIQRKKLEHMVAATKKERQTSNVDTFSIEPVFGGDIIESIKVSSSTRHPLFASSSSSSSRHIDPSSSSSSSSS